MKVLVFLIAEVNHFANQQLQIKQHLFELTCIRHLSRVLLLCADDVAFHQHTILIILKALISSIGGIE